MTPLPKRAAMGDPMRVSRRDVLASTLGLCAVPSVMGSTDRAWHQGEALSWARVRAEFDLDSTKVRSNLGAGAWNPSPRPVRAAYDRASEFINGMPNVNRSVVFGSSAREGLRRRLAQKLNASASEVAFTRGTTEAFGFVMSGTRLGDGDEVITTSIDYPRFINAWRTRSLRDGVRLRDVDVPHPATQAEITEAIAASITQRTAMIMVCHISDRNGQVFPLREICELAHRQGIQVFVDGALAFGVTPVDVQEIGCDYYATSLHKGMYAPTGTGLLYIRGDRIGELLPLVGSDDPESDDIRKFEDVGTQPVAPFAAVATALDFHDAIGTERIRDRLQELKLVWMDALADAPGVRFHTSSDPALSCAAACAGFEHLDMRDVWSHLYRAHGISCFLIDSPFQGLCVRPHIFTQRSEVERCAKVLRHVAHETMAD